MERYEGLQGSDTIQGGGSFVAIEGRGHEICNFTDVHGQLFGYVQPPGKQIDITRLGADNKQDSISGVIVVWTATRPKALGGGTAVVGWYRDATVYRDYQRHKSIPADLEVNGVDGYWIKASSKTSHLIENVDARSFDIPRQVKGGMGQSNVWYADSVEASTLVKQILNYVENSGANSKGRARKRATPDQERNVLVEKAAVAACRAHYEALNYIVTSVEKDNLGWDLVANLGRVKLRIEVKGLSGTSFSVELTPNEYLAFSEQAADYRLAVVIDALSKPHLSLCRYSAEMSRWIIETQAERFIEIQIRQGAAIRCA
jgi:hypothetical protein